MPGRLIDVGGHRLHLSCTGSGTPTVVLEPGGGDMSSNMWRITPAVARETRVCIYDRAGRGWSEPADTPQDGTQIATDLHTLLQRGRVPGPYVLAGHSFGALYVLNYAARYPNEVAGMVLMDSTNPASAAKPVAASPGDRGSYDILGRVSALISVSAQLGLGRLYGQYAYGGEPSQDQAELRANSASASSLRSTIDEYAQANVSMEQAASLRDFADKPLVVLTAGIGGDAKHTAARTIWPPCPPTPCTASSPTPATKTSSRKRKAPLPPPRQSSTSSHRSGGQDRWPGDHRKRLALMVGHVVGPASHH